MKNHTLRESTGGLTTLACLSLVACTAAPAIEAPPAIESGLQSDTPPEQTRPTQDNMSTADRMAEETSLAEAAQNPVASMISLPIQNNTDFGHGPQDATVNVSNIQPVWPFALGEDWNLITRTILPVVYQEEIVPGTGGSEFGLGDTSFTAFFSPSKSEGLIWGVGPNLLLPTSTDDRLGAGEWGAGLGAIALVMPAPWVVGALVSNSWSFEGSVNVLTIQPFVNYNLADGWYLNTVPIITANWEAPSGEQWKVPIGVGAGKIMSIGKQPINVQVGYYNYVESPTNGPDWQLRIMLQFLFPK